MEELAGLYAMLANGGVLQPLRDRRPVEPARRARACGCSVPKPASSRSTCCARTRGPTTTALLPVAHALAGRVEDRHVVGLPRRLVRRRCRAVRARRLDRQLRRRGQPGVRRRRCRGAAVLPDRRRAESGAPDESAPPLGAAARRQHASRCASAAAICRTPIVRTPWTPGTSRASRRSASASCIAPSAIDARDRAPGVPAVCGRHALRGVRVLAVRHAQAVPRGRHAAAGAAAAAGLRDRRSAWSRRASRRRCAT